MLCSRISEGVSKKRRALGAITPIFESGARGDMAGLYARDSGSGKAYKWSANRAGSNLPVGGQWQRGRSRGDRARVFVKSAILFLIICNLEGTTLLCN